MHTEHKGECKGCCLDSGPIKGLGVLIEATSPKMNKKKTRSVPLALKAMDLLVCECYLYSKVHLCIIYKRIQMAVARFHKTFNF